MNNFNFYSKMTQDFILNEGQGPSVVSYIQSLGEVLSSIKPATVSDNRRLEVAKDNLLNIKRHFRRMDERIKFLEEEVKLFQENQEK